MATAPTHVSNAAAGAFGVAAGMDLLSGVFGFLAAGEAADMARSRADMVRMEAEANAQRYAEQAAQFEAHEKVMYLASGVKLAGSPVDVLAATARVAHENMEAIRMGGEAAALNEETSASNSEMQGRAALVGGFNRAAGMGLMSYASANGGLGGKNDGLVAVATMLGRR